MQMAAHGPEEILGSAEGLVFVAAEQPHLDQITRRAHAVQVLADPVERLQVAQAALAFLDVGFQHIALAALPFVPVGPFGKLGLDELRPGVAEQVRPQPVGQFDLQVGMARDETVFQKRGADRHVLARKADAVLHRPAGVAHLQLQVPQHVQHGFDHAFRPGRDLPWRQEQQVHVGMRRHFRAAVTAHGQQRDAFGFGRIGQRVQVAPCDLQRCRHQPVGQDGLRQHQRPRLQRAGGKGRVQRGVALGAGLGQMAHGDGARRCPRRRDVGGDGVQQGRDVDDLPGRQKRRGGRRPLCIGRGVRTRRHRSCGEQAQSRPPGCC